jgi:hypothetical protein
MGLPDLTKNESTMTTTPQTSVAKKTQRETYSVRIILISPTCNRHESAAKGHLAGEGF